MPVRHPLSYLRDDELCQLEKEILRVKGLLKNNDPNAHLAYVAVMERVQDFKRKWGIPSNYKKRPATPTESGSSQTDNTDGARSSPQEPKPGQDD